MISIFTPLKCCKQPLTVLIEGEPCMGKTIFCEKLACDWASKQCGEWDESFPRIHVLMCSSSWNAIEHQTLPDEIKPEEKEMFFQFLKKHVV